MSQETLAFEARLHPTYVSQMERGMKLPTLKTVFQLASALSIRPSRIVQAIEKEIDPKQVVQEIDRNL